MKPVVVTICNILSTHSDEALDRSGWSSLGGDFMHHVLPSLFDVDTWTPEDQLVAVARRAAGPIYAGSIESWDLNLYGEAFEALTSDPFSFAGHFVDRGLSTLRMNLLCPNGFIDPMVWHGDHSGSEFHATIRWMVREM